MGSRLKIPCRNPRCRQLVAGGGYCRTCKPFTQSRFSRDTRGTTSEQGYGAVWQKTRKMFLRQQPLCAMCGSRGFVMSASEVHHLVPLKSGGTSDFSNLQALCKSCHSRITRAVDRGRGGV